MSLARIVIALSTAALGTLCSVQAQAAPAEGLGIGPRTEDGAAGIGIDYWMPRLGLSAAIGGSFSTESSGLFETGTEPVQDTNNDFYEARVSVAGFVPVATGEHTRLALGLRVAFAFTDGFAFSSSDFSQTTLSIQVPLRLQWFTTDRIAIHSEVGLSVERQATEQDEFIRGVPGPGLGRKSTIWTFGDLASPIANLGVTYFF